MRDTLKLKAATPHRWLLALRRGLAAIAETVVVPEHQTSITRDPKDEHVVMAALVAGCHYIITGDKDLLTVGSYQDILILTPADFLELMAG